MTKVLIGDTVRDIREIYLSPMEVAIRLGFSRVTVYKWIYAGKLQAVHFGKSVRIPESEIERIMQKR